MDERSVRYAAITEAYHGIAHPGPFVVKPSVYRLVRGKQAAAVDINDDGDIGSCALGPVNIKKMSCIPIIHVRDVGKDFQIGGVIVLLPEPHSVVGLKKETPQQGHQF